MLQQARQRLLPQLLPHWSCTQQARRWATSSLKGVIELEAGKTRLQGYLPQSFVVNTISVEGPILCLPETWLLWDVKGFEDITPDSLALLDLLDPPPEVVVVGCGSRIRVLSPALTQHLRARGISVEALDTRNAISYFNFLNDEGRQVVGALLPSGYGEA